MKTVILSISAAVLSLIMQPAYAQNIAPVGADAAAETAGEIQQLQSNAQKFPEPVPAEVAGSIEGPPILPQLYSNGVDDSEGVVSDYNVNGQIATPSNDFFKSEGTNGRTCFTCHRPEDGMGLGQLGATNRFAANPTDPLFRLVDGASCPDDDVSTPAAQAQAYSGLTTSGLIRIPLPLQTSFQFEIVNVQDTNGSDCNTNPITGVTGPQSGFANFYRRPIPTASLLFDSNIMWDAREPSLAHQAMDAELGHAQAVQASSTPSLNAIVAFETGMYSAQSSDNGIAGISVGAGGDLTGGDGSGATGGPIPISQELASFSTGINNPFGGSFNPAIYNIYNAFGNLTGTDTQTQERQAIFRGQQIFNTKQFQITGVAGLNDVQGQPSITGTCGTCHNSPNVANFTSNAMMDTGVTAVNAPNGASSHLFLTGLPVFTVQCIAGPDAGQTFSVTDLGFAMTTGQCADIGKTKVPVIRSIASRSPYFHNGSGQDITFLVKFYNARFNIGLTAQEQSDLETFLEAQ